MRIDMVKIIFVLLWCTSGTIFAQKSFDEYPLSELMENVKIITESSSDWKTENCFNSKGYLMKSLSFFKHKKRSEKNYEYSISDSLITIKEDSDASCTYYKFYKKLGLYTRFEIYSSRDLKKPFVVGENFKYKDSLLISYDRNNTLIEYTYNNRGKIIKIKQGFESKEYIYDGQGRATDCIVSTDDGIGVYVDVITVSKSQKNTYHIHYSNFDKHNNWTKSYFVTEHGQKIRSVRQIKY